MAQKLIRYFAYGSNILQERIETRVGMVNKIGTAYLLDHRLVFNYGSIGTYANIEECKGEQVFGVIYELDLWQMDFLDMKEGANVNPAKFYYRVCELIDDKPTHFYISYNTQRKRIFPMSKEYYNYLRDGYEENGEYFNYSLKEINQQL